MKSGGGGGRKNLKRAAREDDELSVQQGHSIMQVLSLPGSNLIEVMDAAGGKSLALLPAKFRKSFWLKQGSFVVVDESGKDEAIESGSKIGCMVVRVLFREQVRALQKSPEWPDIFKTTIVDESNSHPEKPASHLTEQPNSSDEDGLPPLEANTNRIRPTELHSDSDSGS
ncbi:hypothetical protein MRB53_018477 [Persea americana]|uniref:Uncharacterized protein n=1 Tax=Persea americana TaxID=3435 RepID=A0ACC2M885_PERAE|nr:hypothetical protein MRB53_018477 [Persea americana]|eukprot:TRINITY_DN9562_c0_g1_i1.p1 TRINITY_DN9562_c0_g1~~TRINITY_DN9562_c0_g1_i1.p1  ORF type:complete len:170 (-),score=45.30 TRINITY_DN9562_c0_g1_i1:398-907(-)